MEKNLKNNLILALLAAVRVVSFCVSFVMLSVALCGGGSPDMVRALYAPLAIALAMGVVFGDCGHRMKALKPAAVPGFAGGMPPAVPVAA